MKKIFCTILIIVCLATGCAYNTIAAVYDNDKKISSDINSYSLRA